MWWLTLERIHHGMVTGTSSLSQSTYRAAMGGENYPHMKSWTLSNEEEGRYIPGS